MMIKVMQLNGHKSKSVSANLVNELFCDGPMQVALLQEPYCYKGRPACLGRSLQIMYGGGEYPRTAIAATRSTPLWYLQKYSGPV